AGDAVAGLAAERGAQLPVDQPVEDRVLDSQPQGRPAGTVESLAVIDGHPRRAREDLALALGRRLLLGAVVYLLEDAWHREDERGLERRQVRQQVVHVGTVPQDDA